MVGVSDSLIPWEEVSLVKVGKSKCFYRLLASVSSFLRHQVTTTFLCSPVSPRIPNNFQPDKQAFYLPDGQANLIH
jgi:hypothetical protein